MPYFPPQQTAIQILNKLKTVDGSGSGLDADTIDGLHANELSTVAALNDLTDVTISTPSTNQVLLYNGSIWVNGTITSGVTDHGALTGLSDNDHPQYYLASNVSSDAQNFLSAINSSLTYNNNTNRLTVSGGLITSGMRPASNDTSALGWFDASGTQFVYGDTTNLRLGLRKIPAVLFDAYALNESAQFRFSSDSDLQGHLSSVEFVKRSLTGGTAPASGNIGGIICYAAIDSSGTLRLVNQMLVRSDSLANRYNMLCQHYNNTTGALSTWLYIDFVNRLSFNSSSTPPAGAQVGITGSTDRVQFAVRGNSSQSANLIEISNSGATVLAAMTGAGYLALGQSSATALLDLAASTTTRSSLRIRSGTAPTSPNEGDIWYDGTHLYCRIAGVTKQLDN